jgi:carboxyl-terminal processing protease
MRLTTARYYTPSGRSIQAKGIEPDIAVEPAKIERVAAGDRRREADLRGALKNTDKIVTPDSSKPDASKPDASKAAPPPGAPPGATPTPQPESGTVDPSVIGTSEDYQLARAVDMIRGVALFNSRVTSN